MVFGQIFTAIRQLEHDQVSNQQFILIMILDLLPNILRIKRVYFRFVTCTSALFGWEWRILKRLWTSLGARRTQNLLSATDFHFLLAPIGALVVIVVYSTCTWTCTLCMIRRKQWSILNVYHTWSAGNFFFFRFWVLYIE